MFLTSIMQSDKCNSRNKFEQNLKQKIITNFFEFLYTIFSYLTEPAATVCELPDYQGDGYCDDGNNNEGCLFDGGDCCGSDINLDYCTECICYE